MSKRRLSSPIEANGRRCCRRAIADSQRGYTTDALAMLMSVGPAVPLESKLGASNLLAPVRFPSDKCDMLREPTR